MRKLQATDLFELCRLIKILDLKEEVKKAAKDTSETNVWDIGFDVVYVIFEKAISKHTEQAIYTFLAGIFEMDPEEVAKMNPVDLIDGIVEIASPEQWKRLFTRAAALMK